MTVQRWMLRSAPLAIATLAAAAPLAAAQWPILSNPRVMAQNRGTQLFEWTGQVDREVQIVMRGNDVWTKSVGQNERPRARTREYGRLPNGNGRVVVERLGGRGSVDVIQQPSRQNDYTAIVRVRDDQGGSSSYRLAAYWQGSNGDVYGRNDRRDGQVYRDRDRDGRYDNGGRNDNDGRYNNGRSDNNRAALQWSGNVDGDLEIRIQNGRVDYRNLSGSQPTNIRSSVGNMNGRQNETYAVQIQRGRGDVNVVQQPQAWNQYTTIIRVRDPQSGSSYYDFSLIRR